MSVDTRAIPGPGVTGGARAAAPASRGDPIFASLSRRGDARRAMQAAD